MSPADRRDGPSRADLYRDWDAAYVLGSLSPAERLEYEEHLAHCPECSAALADLAGMPSLLASISAEEAFALDASSGAALDDAAGLGGGTPGASATSAGPPPIGAAHTDALDAPPTLLPALLSRARASRRRSRLISVGVGVGSVAAAVALTLITALVIWPVGGASAPGVAAPASSASSSAAPDSSGPNSSASSSAAPNSSGPASPATAGPNGAALASELQLVPQVPGSLSAEASLQDEPWGTRIEWKCTWGGDGSSGAAPSTGYNDGPPPSGSVGYGMIVTDRAGASVQVATWTSDPGTVATPTATTSIRLADIASVAIVAADSGQVLLKSTL